MAKPDRLSPESYEHIATTNWKYSTTGTSGYTEYYIDLKENIVERTISGVMGTAKTPGKILQYTGALTIEEIRELAPENYGELGFPEEAEFFGIDIGYFIDIINFRWHNTPPFRII